MSKTKNISLIDLNLQNRDIQDKLVFAIRTVLNHGQFINGPEVNIFAENLKKYLDVQHVIPCGNGTDALQIALMALGLKQGDEVIIPAFTYAAVIEVIALLRLSPILVDVSEKDYNLDVTLIENAITTRTKAIIPVHLYGQMCNMEVIMNIAKKYNLFVIEDNAQSIGCIYHFSDGSKKKSGTIGHIGTTSFFPTKNLGAFGDGGALMTNDDQLGKRIKMICNHGQMVKYYHEMVGVNSRLDTIQAAILNVKLDCIDHWARLKNKIAQYYNEQLSRIEGVSLPERSDYSEHVYHQYTIRVSSSKRNDLIEFLKNRGIQTMVYYPLPLHMQNAYRYLLRPPFSLNKSETLSDEVLSLPIHTEMNKEDVVYIAGCIEQFFL